MHGHYEVLFTVSTLPKNGIFTVKEPETRQHIEIDCHRVNDVDTFYLVEYKRIDGKWFRDRYPISAKDMDQLSRATQSFLESVRRGVVDRSKSEY